MQIKMDIIMKKVAVALYVRVSSTNGTQDYQRQINDLTAYVNQNNYEIVKIFAEKISGVKKNTERPALMDMIEFVKQSAIDKVLCLECSRIGRSLLDCLAIIQTLTEHKVSLLIVNNQLETLDEKGNINPITQLVLNVMFSFANMEKQLILDRVQSGYKNHLANGGSVGRKIGYRKDVDSMKTQYAEDIKLLRKGYSLRNIQKITGTSVNTLRKVKEII